MKKKTALSALPVGGTLALVAIALPALASAHAAPVSSHPAIARASSSASAAAKPAPKPHAPEVTTGAAALTGISSAGATATIAGVVNPEGVDTLVAVQYGPTTALGSQTPPQDIGAGTARVPVSLGIGGLAAVTKYYYRVVGVSSAGATLGAVRSLVTPRIPLTVGLLATPNPVPYKGTVTLQGTLSGTGNAGREVVLEANPFPFTAGLMPILNAEVTNADGSFTFIDPDLTVNTQFQVVSPATPGVAAVASPLVGEAVSEGISAHVAKAHKPNHARFFGTVTPAAPGALIDVNRVLGSGRFAYIGSTTVSSHSTYSVTLKLKGKGLYRIYVKVTSGAELGSYSTPLLVR